MRFVFLFASLGFITKLSTPRCFWIFLELSAKSSFVYKRHHRRHSFVEYLNSNASSCERYNNLFITSQKIFGTSLK